MHQKLLEHSMTTGEKNDPNISFKLVFVEFEPNSNRIQTNAESLYLNTDEPESNVNYNYYRVSNLNGQK